jgi:hypothetical protein
MGNDKLRGGARGGGKMIKVTNWVEKFCGWNGKAARETWGGFSLILTQPQGACQ